jgi:hypothetical protein
MTDFGKVAVGVRIGVAPRPAFFVCWTRLVQTGLEPGDVVMDPAIGLPHAPAANALVARFLETDCDSLLFVDDDMVFDPDALRKLRADDGGHGMVGALYATRRRPYTPIAWRLAPNDEDPDHMVEIEPHGVGIMRVDLLGLGFTLIRRRWLSLNCFEWSNRRGEDGEFCKRLRESGGTIGCNLGVRPGHRAEISVYCKLELDADNK